MTAPTQAAAYRALRGSEELGARQKDVLSLVRLHPGKTAIELTKIMGWADPNRIRPRLVELAQAGYIEPAGNRECSVTGRAAMTWRLVSHREQGELGL